MGRQTRLWLALALGLGAGVAHADLQDELDNMFGSMTNATAPTAYIGQRRGVLSGGSVVARNQISNMNLLNLQLPSFSAGCGGIDLFGGSFSFINLDQFIQLLRNVASNAAGYAFEVALGAMCKDCLQTIESLQKKVQSLNSMFSNSCQLAQGIVDNTLGAVVQNHLAREKSTLLEKGAGDSFEVSTSVTGQTPNQMMAAQAPAEDLAMRGNLVWRALVEHGVAAWYTAGDEQLMRVAMSLTGGVIVGDRQPTADGDSTPVITRFPAILNLRTLVNGSGTDPGQTVEVYTCTDGTGPDECQNLGREAVTVDGLAKRVRDLFLGGGGNPGLITAFRSNAGPFTPEQIAFMEKAPGGIGAQIRNLARLDEGLAVQFVSANQKALALTLAYALARDIVTAVQTAVGMQDTPFTKESLAHVAKSMRALEEEYDSLVQTYGSPRELLADYVALARAALPSRYEAASRRESYGFN